MAESIKRYAVVTGSNKGIGLEICRQLASNGVIVVLTSRNETNGLEAVDKLHKDPAINPEHVIFHQLNVVDPTSVATLGQFIKAQFGKLDILVNNAGIGGAILNPETLRASDFGKKTVQVDRSVIVTQTYELAEQCLETNYYGYQKMVEAFTPLLQLSDSPRIVNVSSFMGKLESIANEWAKKVFSDVESLTEEKVDQVLNEFMKDFKEESLEAKGWPAYMSAYILSKAAVNAYTRILAKNYPSKFCINAVCPGYVKTDINLHCGFLSVEEGAASPVKAALLPKGGPSGLFFFRQEVSPF